MSKLHIDEIENCIRHSWRTRHFYDARDQFKTLLDALKEKDAQIAQLLKQLNKYQTGAVVPRRIYSEEVDLTIIEGETE